MLVTTFIERENIYCPNWGTLRVKEAANNFVDTTDITRDIPDKLGNGHAVYKLQVFVCFIYFWQ